MKVPVLPAEIVKPMEIHRSSVVAHVGAGDGFLDNVVVVKGDPDDPYLPASKLDAVVILNSYHEMPRNEEMLRRLLIAEPSPKPGEVTRAGQIAKYRPATRMITRIRPHIRLYFVIRFVVFVCLAVLPALAADEDLNRVLKGIQDRYNHAQTLQVSFNETYTVQGRPRQSESGSLTLRKPGRMRWDYTTPPGKLFISDGKDVYLYTPEAKRVEKMELKKSEDMRAPLAFLLGKLDFRKEFRDFDMIPEGPGYVITAKAKSEKLPYEAIRLTVTPEFVITNLVITGQDQSILTFNLSGEKLNPTVNDSSFKFRMPPGATMAQEAAQ